MKGLALRRREGESIILTLPSGERIAIGLAETGRECKLVIDAPKSVLIEREELYLQCLCGKGVGT